MSEITLTEFEKQVYNYYLAAVGRANNRPFRPRKNFEVLDDEKALELRKLSAFFKKYGEIDLQDFFFAPFHVHPDDKFQPLTYFSTQAAVNAYTRFKKQIDTSINSVQLLEYTKRGLTFLLKYCIEHKLTIERYKQQTTKGGVPICMLHLKQHKINFFIVHALELQEEIYKLDREWREFYVRDFDQIFRDTYKTFTYSSLKEKIQEITKLIRKKLKNKYENDNV